MAKTPSAFLGDFPIMDIGQGWTFNHGVEPGFAQFELVPEHAEELLEGPLKPVTLNIDGTEIKNLLPLVKAPTFNPNVTRVLVTDRRWYWQHLILDQGFNQRRHIGVRRISGAAGTPDELRPVVATVDYEPWSLQDRNTPWDALEVLDEVMARIVKLEKDAGLNLGGFKVEHAGLSTTIEIENLNLAGTAATGIQQILRYIPTLRLAMTNDGTAKFYSYSAADEKKDIIETMGTEMWDEGTIAELFTEFRRVRPKEVRVYFDIEAEVRLDFEEKGRGGGTTADFDGRTCDNVLVSTDYNLNHLALGTISQGTWVRIDDRLFDSWGTMPLFDKRLSFPSLYRYMLPHHDFHFQQLVNAGSFTAEADWAGRLQSIKSHWRKTYRINRRWVDAYRHVFPYRVATLDRATGHRAPAMVWYDYFVQGTQRLINAGKTGVQGGAQQSPYGFNVKCLSKQGSTNLDTDGSVIAAPANVVVLDSDQGIITYEMQQDIFRVREIFFPGTILNVPTPSDVGALLWNGYVSGRDRTQISPDFKAVFIVTMTPGTSSNRRHLFEVVIKPNDVKSVLPSGLRSGLNEAQGPPIEIKVGAGIETARLAWSDRLAQETESVFGFGNPDKKPDIERLCVNYKKNNLGASIWSIAVAAAAQVYAGYSDRHQGSATTTINKDMEMTGLMQEMSHRLDQDGAAVTQVSMEFWDDFSIDPQSMMPAATRRFINKIATVAR